MTEFKYAGKKKKKKPRDGFYFLNCFACRLPLGSSLQPRHHWNNMETKYKGSQTHVIGLESTPHFKELKDLFTLLWCSLSSFEHSIYPS